MAEMSQDIMKVMTLQIRVLKRFKEALTSSNSHVIMEILPSTQWAIGLRANTTTGR